MNRPEWQVYNPGDVVKLDGGPWDQTRHELTGKQAEQVFVPVPNSKEEPTIQTPNFDAAFGLPTPEPCNGYYRPYVPGDTVWHWFKAPATLFKPVVGSLPYYF